MRGLSGPGDGCQMPTKREMTLRIEKITNAPPAANNSQVMAITRARASDGRPKLCFQRWMCEQKYESRYQHRSLPPSRPLVAMLIVPACTEMNVRPK